MGVQKTEMFPVDMSTGNNSVRGHTPIFPSF